MSSTALRSALAFLTVAVLAPALTAIGWLPPLAGFGICAGAVLIGGLVSVVAGWISSRRATRRAEARWPGRLAAALGVLLLGAGAAAMSGSVGAPPIHDITTSPERPPRFEALAAVPDNLDRDMRYPHGRADTAVLQQQAYPELAPVALAAEPPAAWQRSLDTARLLGWQITAADRARLRIEATDTTAVFRFVDDVVIEVERAEAGSLIHVRSMSRVGRSDLGANAARIGRFIQALRSD